jgi:hypothetical protein
VRANAFEYAVADVPGRKATSNCAGTRPESSFWSVARNHVDALVVRVEDLADDTDSLSPAVLGHRDRVADRRACRVQKSGGHDDLAGAREPVAADEVVARPSRRAAERRDRNRIRETGDTDRLIGLGDDVRRARLGVYGGQDRALRHGRRRLRAGRILPRSRDDRRADTA